MNRILKLALVTILTFLILVFILVYTQKDAIAKKVVEEIERATDTDIDYSDTHMGIIGSFPNTEIIISDLNIRASQDIDTLQPFLSLKTLGLTLNPIKIITKRESIHIDQLTLNQPAVTLIHSKNGTTNWPNINSEENEESGTNSQVAFKNIDIDNGNITYVDYQKGIKFLVDELNYEGHIDLDQELITQMGNGDLIFSVEMPSFPSIKDYRLVFGSKLINNVQEGVYSIENSKVSINDLDLILSGSIDNHAYQFDVASTEQDFRNLLSIISDIDHDTDVIKEASGKFSVDGKIKGQLYSDTYPQYNLQVDTDNGRFLLPKYSDEEVFVDLSLEMKNTDQSTLYEILRLNTFNLKSGHDEIKSTATIRNQNNVTQVNYDIKADIGDINKYDDLTSIDLTSGDINLISSGDFDIESIDNNDWNDLIFNIDLEAENVQITNDSISIAITMSEALGDQKSIAFKISDAIYSNTDISGEGIITRPLKYLAQMSELDIDFKGSSKMIDLNQLLTSAEDTLTNSPPTLYKGNIEIEAKDVKYSAFNIEEMTLNAVISENILTVNDFTGSIEESNFALNGSLENLNNYLYGDGILNGELEVTSDNLELDRLETIYYEGIDTSQNISNKPIFNRMNILLSSKSKKLSYRDMSLSNNVASLRLNDNNLKVNNVTSESYGGNLLFEGNIEFGNEESVIDLKTDFANISIAESLKSLPYLGKLGYPLSFIDGKINTTMTMSSAVDGEFNFILSKVDAFALLETLDGKIDGFRPLEKLNELLQFQEEKKEVLIKQSKNWVTIQDGWVQVEEFDFSIGDYHFKVNGAHSLENQLNYTILADVPAAKITKVNFEDVIDQRVIEKLNRYRNVRKGSIGLVYEMKGTMNKPILKLNDIDLISASRAAAEQIVQEAKDTIISTVDSLKVEVTNQVKDTVNVIIDKAEDKAKEVIDSIKTEVTDELKSRLDSTLVDQLDSVSSKILKENIPLDSLKDKIIELKDIFKRKKSE